MNPTKLRRACPAVLHDAFDAALDQGWRIKVTGKGHLRWLPPDRTRQPVHTARTPSDYRSIRNALAELRRSGLEI